MKKLILFFTCFNALSVYGQMTKRILFIGNSYTYSNNMPEMLKSISQSVGDDIFYDSNLIGGSTLQMHSTNATTLAKIQQGNWDFVVLQDQSQIPAFPENYVQTNVYPFAQQLDNQINTYNNCAETVFFMTWGRKNGDSDYCSTYSNLCTYEGMDDLLRQRYLYMANQNSGIVSPVGAVWRQIRTLYPSLDLYEADESHPNLLGSYAAALTFYATLFRKNPELVTYQPSSITNQDAIRIKSTVKNIVFDQMTQWNIGKYDPFSDFTTVQNNQNSLEFSFQNQSQHADHYLWNFGDGQQSNQTNPVHIYAQPGHYDVTLTASRCGYSAVKLLNIDTNALSTKEVEESVTLLYPNPGKEKVHIKTKKPLENVTINDSSGKLVHLKIEGNTININSLNSGIYYFAIKFKNDDKVKVIKFLKR